MGCLKLDIQEHYRPTMKVVHGDRKVAQRWLSLDPLASDFVSWSPYNYVMGNPIMLIDPDGRSPDDPNEPTDPPPTPDPNATKAAVNGEVHVSTGKIGIEVTLFGVQFGFTYSLEGAGTVGVAAEAAVFNNGRDNFKAEFKQSKEEEGGFTSANAGIYGGEDSKTTERTTGVSTRDGTYSEEEVVKTETFSVGPYTGSDDEHKVAAAWGFDINLLIIGVGAQVGLEMTDPK